MLSWYYALDVVEKIGLWGSIASIIGLIIAFIPLASRVLRATPKQIAIEIQHSFHSKANILSLIATILCCAYAFLFAYFNNGAEYYLPILFVVTSFLILLFSIFISQNSTLLRNIILKKISTAIRRSDKICSAIKFDIDLIVAINDYSHATGSAVFDLAMNTLRNHEKRLRGEGVVVESIDLPEADETIWILPGMTIGDAADIADNVRREYKQKLSRIPYYQEACDFVIRKLQSPPLTEEEKGGIGTLSAGVAAYGRGAEALLSDISSAIKTSKFRGRNRTVIYQRDGEPLLREH